MASNGYAPPISAVIAHKQRVPVMSGNEELDNKSIANSIAKTITSYTWLFADTLIFLALSICLVAYKDFDEPMRNLTRILIVLFLIYAWISSLHILASMRSVGRGHKMLPSTAAYIFPFLKLCALGGLIYWSYFRKLL